VHHQGNGCLIASDHSQGLPAGAVVALKMAPDDKSIGADHVVVVITFGARTAR
jgi:hypothetical protein